jgi:hypothetical protein
LSGSCVVVVLVLAGTDRVRLRLVGLVRGGYGAARWRGSAKVPGRRIAGRQQVHELAAAAESLSKPGVRGVLPGGARGVVPRQGNPAPEVLLPAVPGSWTGLYTPVRGIGGAGGPAHVHMVDSVVAAGIP